MSATKRDYSYYQKIMKGQRMPMGFIDLDVLDVNIAAIAKRAGDKRLRMASKSIRCLNIIERILAFGNPYAGIMCYSGWEAVWLHERGLDDLMVAYPIVHAGQVEAVCKRIEAGGTLTLMIDCVEQLDMLEPVARDVGVTLPIAIDIDMSADYPGLHFGVRRSPIQTPEQIAPILDALEGKNHLKLDGVMGYEAQIAGVPDRAFSAAKNALIGYLKKRSVAEVAERRAAIVEAIEARGHKLRFVNGGGTGSLEWTRQESALTEVTAGSGFYCSTLFDNFSNFHHEPSAGFAIEITRRPLDGIYTCHGGGYVASGSAGKEKVPQPYLPEGATLIDMEMAGEVQTPIVYNGPQVLGIGDPIFMRHAKAGEICEHINEMALIQDGKIVDVVKTYRGEGECFLG